MPLTATAPPAQPELSKAARLLRRTRTGGLLVLALVGALWITGLSGAHWPVLLIGAVLGLALVVEVERMGKLAALRARWPLLFALLGVTLVAAEWLLFADADRLPGPTSAYLRLCLTCLASTFLTMAIWRGAIGGRRPTRRAFAATLALALWLTVPLPGLALVRAEWGHGALIALFVLSKVGDIAAYYGGNAFGRHHPLPRLSPSKTSEGFACSLLAGLLVGGLLALWGLLPGGFVAGLLAGLVINVAAQGGDLVESAVKRRAEVKDSGTWMGASGGLLDVLDSLLLTVPTALLLWPLILP